MNVPHPAALLVARLEWLPLSRWHLWGRMIIGSATFFDGVDIIAIGLVLPVLLPIAATYRPQTGFPDATGSR